MANDKDYCYGKAAPIGVVKDYVVSDEDYVRQWYGNLKPGYESTIKTTLLYQFDYTTD
eukprot:CAMPEP_0116873758 /NCGR_PEP_ID=MMETSP0463-20121206/5042_1 /TAXON_ID=181622 /ORGANISM="Strombidinopsis sp, Strain SopsisLIS2011" /LENGTH=57 /DNA_ID=CAMNT_0004516367 /DNA_START=14 /DNA_END=187 /DNA_ORIENTATION=+